MKEKEEKKTRYISALKCKKSDVINDEYFSVTNTSLLTGISTARNPVIPLY